MPRNVRSDLGGYCRLAMRVRQEKLGNEMGVLVKLDEDGRVARIDLVLP